MRFQHRDRKDDVTTLSDNRLLQQLNAGDETSFNVLFQRHYDRVYGLLFRLVGNRAEAEDIAQEVFLKLYRQPLLGRPDDNIGGWLYRVATNLGYNAIRDRQRRWQRDRFLVPDQADAPDGPQRLAERREARERVQRALARLKPRQVQLLLLRQMGFSYAELAEACDVAPGSVGQLLGRAAAAFRDAYDEVGD